MRRFIGQSKIGAGVDLKDRSLFGPKARSSSRPCSPLLRRGGGPAKSAACGGTGRFFAREKYRTNLLAKGTAPAVSWPKAGKTIGGLRPLSASRSLPSILKSSGWLWAPVGMWAKASISPSLRSKTGKAQLGRLKADCPHIHGRKAGFCKELVQLVIPAGKGGRCSLLNWVAIGISGTVIRGRRRVKMLKS